MEIFMRNIPYTVDYIQLTIALEPVLHEPVFSRHISTGGPMNFKVYLFPDKHRRRYHSGCGTLTLPSHVVGEEFLRQFANKDFFLFPQKSFKLNNREISFQLSNKPPRPDFLQEIQLLPYRDPRAILHEQARFAKLSGEVRLTDVQFMWHCRDYALSIEWQWNNEDDLDRQDSFLEEDNILQFETAGYDLRFDAQTRRIVVREHKIQQHMIIMRYSRIEAVEIDVATNSLVLFLAAQPSYEKVNPSLVFLRLQAEMLQEKLAEPDVPKSVKLLSIGTRHALVAPYTWNVIRLICETAFDVEEFRRMAEVENIHVHDGSPVIVNLGRFAPPVLEELEAWLSTLSWPVAFQCKRICTDMLLDPIELLSLRTDVSALIATYGSDHVTEVLRQFSLKLLRLWDDAGDRTFEKCFTEATSDIAQGGWRQQLESNDMTRLFQCLHLTFTPSAMGLTGPFPDTSNRILRQYPNNHDAFLRVSWTDEDGLQFRFDRREIDSSEFIEERVGNVLKKGFKLCGRKFEFLAYSQSALKQYTVWFVHPFRDLNGHRITAEYIRESIGSDWSKESELMLCPARYAARLSQAFTATEFSICAEPGEISRIKDIERNGFCFSDGNGLVSLEMADAIQEALLKNSGKKNGSLRAPVCFQVRIQGAKGVLNTDTTLEGRQILLRPSMIKFEKIGLTDIEIARSFNKPIKFFLNRPLVMILWGLGVNVNIFLGLQADAVNKTNEAAKSLKGAADLLETHGMGTAFALSSTFLHLRKLGVKLEPSLTPRGFRDVFMDTCLKFAIHHVLRDIKLKTRIPVPDCWKLVGIVDAHNILEQDQIYGSCIVRGEGAPRVYMKGRILISKSPTIHPGDVQIANAIGEPPVNSPLGHLVNCVVFSQRGNRPLPNKLSGSDLDGDEYDLITLSTLHPIPVAPGEYSPTPRLRLNRPCNIDDVADFITNYIINDMLGLVSINFLLIADTNGIFDNGCKKLASLHSWAVDFPKNGIPVPPSEIPYPQSYIRPDWYAPEIVDVSIREKLPYYESQSVIGKMFREIKLPVVSTGTPNTDRHRRARKANPDVDLEHGFSTLSLDSLLLDDIISSPLRRKLMSHIDLDHTEEMFLTISGLFDHFVAELEHIGYSCSLSKHGARRLAEEELLVGTITAKTTQPRIRKDNMASVREETTILVQRALKELEGGQNDTISEWANRAWVAWEISLMKKRTFGARSFGFMALRAIFDAIKELERD